MFACQSPGSKSTENTNSIAGNNLKSALPGTWETIAFQVNIQSFQNTDSTFTMEIKEGEWESQMQMRPIQTVYELTNKYYSTYKNLSDSVIRIERGIWNVFGDTLLLVSPDATYTYQFLLQNEKAELRTLLDWDGDGQEDDEYIGIQKRIKK